MLLQEHNIDIKHIKGKDNIIADALSCVHSLMKIFDQWWTFDNLTYKKFDVFIFCMDVSFDIDIVLLKIDTFIIMI